MGSILTFTKERILRDHLAKIVHPSGQVRVIVRFDISVKVRQLRDVYAEHGKTQRTR